MTHFAFMRITHPIRQWWVDDSPNLFEFSVALYNPLFCFSSGFWFRLMLGIVSEMLEMAFVVRSCSEINDATANWSGSPAFWKKNRLPFFFFFLRLSEIACWLPKVQKERLLLGRYHAVCILHTWCLRTDYSGCSDTVFFIFFRYLENYYDYSHFKDRWLGNFMLKFQWFWAIHNEMVQWKKTGICAHFFFNYRRVKSIVNIFI